MSSPSVLLAVLITSLVALGPLSTDFYLPALPAITAAFDTDVGTTQLTLSVFLIGFGVGQLAYGPLSDRFGRRPVLLAGLIAYVLATVVCAFAPSIETLIAARFLQSLGACAGPVLGRTIVRDLYGPRESARVLSYMSSAMALASLVGPFLGGVLTVWLGWQATFAFLVLFSTTQAFMVWRILFETNANPDPDAIRPARMLSNFAVLSRDLRFRGLLLCNAFSYAGLMAFISGAPFVFIGIFGFSPQLMGLAFSVMVSGYIVGTMLSGRFSRRMGAARLLYAGGWVGALGGTTMLMLALAEVLHPAAVMAPMWLVSASIGLVMPNATALALAPYPRMAGSAASLLGFVQMGLAAVFGVAVGQTLGDTYLPVAIGVGTGGVGCLLSYFIWVRGALGGSDAGNPG